MGNTWGYPAWWGALQVGFVCVDCGVPVRHSCCDIWGALGPWAWS